MEPKPSVGNSGDKPFAATPFAESSGTSPTRRDFRPFKLSEEYLRLIVESSSDIILVSDRSGTVLFVSGACKDFGYEPSEVVGKAVAEFLHPDDLKEQNEIRRRATQPGLAFRAQARILRRDGSWVTCELIERSTTDPEGNPILITTVRNVTERLEAQRKIDESAAMLRKVFEACPDVISVTRFSDGGYVDANAALASSGFDKHEALGKSVAALGMWADKAQARELVRRLREHGIARNMEVDHRLRDGRIVPCLLSSVMVEINGEPSVVTFTRDITELKRTENELRAAREAALAASRSKSEFLSSMSHEIRTPMNAILGMADLLWETELTDEQRYYLDTIIGSGSTLLGLINDVLDLARVEAGRLKLEAVDFDVIEVTEKVADALAVRAHEKGIELALRFEPGLHTALIGDPLRLRQVLTNLIGNAIKFTEVGEVVVGVKRNPDGSNPGSLLFAVSDTGIGIPADRLAAIFSPFTQVDSSTTRKFGGSGLGLTIVERLVHLMGGSVWVESEPAKGSTFYFTVELGVRGAPQTITEPPAEPDLTGMRVLVVDDHAVNRIVVREMLAARGALVSESASAPEGLQAIDAADEEGKPFQLLVVDCMMPVMDGFEMVRQIRADPRRSGLLIMMLSSNALNVTMSRMKELGLNYYMVKPIKRRELYAAVAKTLASAGITAARGAPAPKRAHALDTGAPVLNRPLRILLADDSNTNRSLVRAYLRKTPYELDEAEDGEAAVEKFKAGNYDLVLMDLQMPRVDGYTAVRMIRQWESERHAGATPIIALSAAVLEDSVRHAKEAGCDLHVSKPVKKAFLLESIAKAAGSSLAARVPASPTG